MTAVLSTGAPRPSHPSGPVVPGGPTGPGRAELLDTTALLLGSVQVLVDRKFPAAFADQPMQLGEVRHSLAFLRRAVAELASQTPARQGDPSGAAAGFPLDPGGPVQPSAEESEKELTPSSAAAVPPAARGSRRPGPAAGASSGREKSARPEGGAPGVPQLPAAAPNVPALMIEAPGHNGRSGGASGAATQKRTEDERGFSLPVFSPPSFDGRS